MKTFLILVSIVVLIIVIYMLFQNTQSKEQGVDENGLFKCHWKPNCISSADINDKEHYYPAFKTDKITFEKLATLLKASPELQIIQQDATYIHAVASTKIGFKDDLEFYFDTATQLCHVRSVSRVGIRDFGVNKKRMDKILKRLDV